MKRVIRRVIIDAIDHYEHMYLNVYRHKNEIDIRKSQLMKRRIKNVDFYFYNNVRVIERVKRQRFM